MAEVTSINYIFELDIGRLNSFWVNYEPFIWYLNLDDVYPLISTFLPNHGDFGIENIGSVLEDSEPLQGYASLASLSTYSGSFYFDGSTKTLYIRCNDDEKPTTHRIFIGQVYGASKHPEVFNGVYYAPILRNVGALTQSKDPLYFGKIKFNNFNVTLDNLDGTFDRLAEDFDVFGNRGRLYVGFDQCPRGEYSLLFSGFIGGMKINSESLQVNVQDERRKFSRTLPDKVFDVSTYPDIKESNINKPIPIAYGEIRNAPIMCVNESESPSPSSFNFVICDTTYNAISSIDTVYVNGSSVTPSSTDLTAGTLVLSSGDYSPGDEVTIDFIGAEDIGGNEISNGLYVIRDLLNHYYGLPYNNTIYNAGEWNLAELNAPDIGLYIDSNNNIFNIIEQIANSLQTDIFYHSDGRLTSVKYESGKEAIQTIKDHEFLELPIVEYDPTEVTTSTTIYYDKDLQEDEYRIYVDKSQEDTLFLNYKTYINKEVETLLVNESDAESFSDTFLEITSVVKKVVTFTVPLTVVCGRGITDFLNVPLIRRSGEMIGTAKCEIINISRNLMSATAELSCRIIEILEEPTYQEAKLWGEDVWNGTTWSTGIAGGDYGL